jgi:hypothetical protein
MLRIPYCLDNRLIDGGKIVSPAYLPCSIPQKHYFSASGTHLFLLEAEQTPGPSAAGRIR